MFIQYLFGGSGKKHILLIKLYIFFIPKSFIKTIINICFWDFPGGPVVKNPPSNAGDMGSIPDRGTKIPHAAGQLSLRTTAIELMRLN